MSTQSAPNQSRPVALIEARQRLRSTANQLPQRPGVYIMRDVQGTIIYIGKAVNLRRRVGSYAAPSAVKDRKVAKLVSSIQSLSHIEVHSELEALLIESRLIKINLPALNRQLIDPESCCFVRVDPYDHIPRLDVVRLRADDRTDYLGPFWHSSFVREAVEAVSNTFRLRRCSGAQSHREVVCMYYELGKCSGPCAGRVSEQEYRRSVTAAWDSLAGKSDEAHRLLTSRRDRLADGLRFEAAHAVHRQIRALEQVVSSVPDCSVMEGDFAVVVPSYLRGRPVVLVFRNGRLASSSLSSPRAYPDPEMIAARLIRARQSGHDLLPGKPSRDDGLIINSHLNRQSAKGILIPLAPDAPIPDLADSIHSAIETLRRH